MGMFDQFLGARTPKLKSCLGLYLSLETAYLCETHMHEKGSIVIDHLVRLPFPTMDKSQALNSAAMNAGFFTGDKSWTKVIQQAMRQIGWKTNKVVVTISAQFGILRHFVMPKIERRFWNQSVPLESKKYIPVSFEEVVYDFQVHPIPPTNDGKARMGIIFGVTSRKILESLYEILQRLGLELMAFEMSAFSVARLFATLGKEDQTGIGYMHFDSGAAYILIPSEGHLILSREINLGNTDAQITERRKVDMRGSLDFVNKQMGGKVCKQISISGENTEVWKTLVEREGGLPVQGWNPASALGLKSAEWGTYSAIGASSRLQFTNVLNLDFSGKSKSCVEERQAIAYVWILGIVCSGLLLLISLVNEARLIFLKKQLQAKKATVSNVIEFQGQTAEMIADTVEKMKTKRTILATIIGIGKGDYLVPKLTGLVDTIPDNIWISKLEYSNPLVTSAIQESRKEFLITGHVELRGKTDAISQAERFRESLQRNPEFMKAYGAPGGSIKLSVGLGLSGDQEGTGQKGRQTSTFKIICSKKRGKTGT